MLRPYKNIYVSKPSIHRSTTSCVVKVRVEDYLSCVILKGYPHGNPAFSPLSISSRHACTEGPEPLNVYSGNIILDVNGETWVDLPSYFQEINKDFRYQLTPIGNPSVLYIAEEISNNRFKIGGGTPGMKVSWRVEGVRNDLWNRQHKKPVEEEKPALMQGKYLHPELFGQPKELAISPVDGREQTLANTHAEPLKLEQPHDVQRPREMAPPNESKPKPEARKQ